MPNVFATPLGVDLCTALIEGLDNRLAGHPPEALARAEIWVANGRMERRLKALYAARGAGLLPRIRPVQAIGEQPFAATLAPALSPLSLRLELAQLIAKLIDKDPSLAPRAALYDLADSLADFMGEMAEEGVSPDQIAALDMGEHSQHWTRAQAFLGIASDLIRGQDHLIPEARQSVVITRLSALWQASPPTHPVIVAGSTGSRGVTFRLMTLVAGLPTGAVILPGLDRDMRADVWGRLLDGRSTGLAGEDHPQYRLARFFKAIGQDPAHVRLWSDMRPVQAARNRVTSLALRPAPVTHQWRTEGPRLPDIAGAMEDVTLLEAPTPQIEATAIALRLRQAVAEGQRAALVTPDRRLARQVTAQLDRWRILPDDSAGDTLAQSAPGRFLRQIAEARSAPLTAEALVALLKHPLCHSNTARGEHLLRTVELELKLLRRGVAFPNRAALMDWALTRDKDPGTVAWVNWISDVLIDASDSAPQLFADHVTAHIAQAEAMAAGPGTDGAGDLYGEEPGTQTARLLTELRDAAEAGGVMSARGYADFFSGLTHDRDVRNPIRPHADILIWGTQEARVQGADLTIMAGLNEGVWPGAAQADPWLNRPLRADAGLRLPDRVIGLSAHDFQQGFAGREVWLSRALRDDETDTVPSRWVNRLTNLLDGASDASQAALVGMRTRGQSWLAKAQALLSPEVTVAPEPRPAPAPQGINRLNRLSVTDVERLIRDPYAIYAQRILGLRRLDPLRAGPDARQRGTAIHKILETFQKETDGDLPPDALDRLARIAEATLSDLAPWPATRRLWAAKLRAVAPWYLEQEAEFRSFAETWMVESTHDWEVPGLDLTLRGKADRIDRLPDGRVAIYDYKTGAVPTDKQARAFNKQLWLEALMARGGAFAGQSLQVARLAYVGLGSTPDLRFEEDIDTATLDEIAGGLHTLVTHYRSSGAGFTSRRATKDTRFDGDYDHLARYGEWDETDEAKVIPVGGQGDG